MEHYKTSMKIKSVEDLPYPWLPLLMFRSFHAVVSCVITEICSLLKHDSRTKQRRMACHIFMESFCTMFMLI